jgi:hypothetical protein
LLEKHHTLATSDTNTASEFSESSIPLVAAASRAKVNIPWPCWARFEKWAGHDGIPVLRAGITIASTFGGKSLRQAARPIRTKTISSTFHISQNTNATARWLFLAPEHFTVAPSGGEAFSHRRSFLKNKPLF